MFYHTFVQPYLEYCNIIWATDSSSSTALASLFCKQKRVFRVISLSKWKCHTSPIFYRYRIITLYSINKLQMCSFISKSLNGLLPAAFHDIFMINMEVHDHNTRQKSDIHIISHRIVVRRQSIKVYGTKLWNSLSPSLKNLDSFPLFRHHYIEYILTHQ